jgi:large repetitive protein
MATINVSSAAQLATALQSVTAGTTILLSSGNYGSLELSNKTLPDGVVIASADSNNPAVFTGLDLSNVNNLTIDGVKLDYVQGNGDDLWYKPFALSSCNNITIKNSTFDGALEPGVGLGTGWGLYVDSSSHITVEGSTFYNWAIAAVFNEGDHITIKDNVIHSVREGIDFANVASDLTIDGNYITDVKGVPGDHVDMLQGWGDGTLTNLTITNNYLSSGDNEWTQSIFFEEDIKNGLIQNNVIFNGHPNAVSLVSGLYDVSIDHNTILANYGGANFFAEPKINLPVPYSNVTVTNNIIMGEGGYTKAQSSGNLVVSYNPADSNYVGKLFDGGGEIVSGGVIPVSDFELVSGSLASGKGADVAALLADMEGGSSSGGGSSGGSGGPSDPANTAPDAVNDGFNTNEDTPLTIKAASLLANDTDANGDSLTITKVAGGTHGTAVLNANGSVTFTPAANYSGQGSFTYTVSDGKGGTDTATVTVNVAPQNDAPVARDDTATTHSPVTIDVLANDSDPDNDTLTVIAATAQNGDVVINKDNTVTYTPHAGFVGVDTLNYTISDGHGATASAKVAVTSPPEAGSGEALVQVRVSGQDYNGEPQFRLIVDGQQVGDVQTVTADFDAGQWQTVDFVVNAPFNEVKVEFVNDYYGGSPDTDRNLRVDWISINGVEISSQDSLYDRYGWSDIPGQQNVDYAGALVFDVSNRDDLFPQQGTPQNDAPVAANDVASLNEDSSVAIAVLANDTDPNGDTLSVTAASATHGTVKVNTNGTITYTPNANFNGSDAITYSVSDGKGGTDTATVAVTVAPVNDAPVAQNDVATSHSPVTIDVLANDSDPDNDALTVTKASAPHGTVVINSDNTLTYNPNDGFSGQDTVSYTISDGHGGTATAKVTVTVALPSNAAPVAANDSAATNEGAPVTINVLANDSDPDGDALSVTKASAANGTVVINADNTLTYNPNDGFSGKDTVSYTVSDGHGGTATATAAVTVDAVAGPVDYSGLGTAYLANTDTDQFLNVNFSDGAAVDPALAQDKLTVVVELDASNPGASQVDKIVFDLDNGAYVTSQSMPPYVLFGDTGPGEYNDGQVFAPGEHLIKISYVDADGNVLSSETINFTVGAAGGNAPEATNDTASTNEDTAVTIAVLANDSDPNGDALTVTEASAANGTVKVNTDGTITYTPKADFWGSDAITYKISDGNGGTDTATVAVTVAAVNDAPVAHNDVATSHSPVTIDVLANDSDPDGDALSVTNASAPNGTVVINDDNTLTYNPNDGFSGQDTVSYTISDGHGGSASATVAVTVASDAPNTSGEQLIQVRVSGDYYQGAPEFRLLIDGQQVGDVHSVSAVHSSDQWQTFDFNVDAPGGFDQIQVQFLNDAFGGSEAQDRNLYVAEVDVNGVALAPTEATYDRPGKSDIAGQSTMAWQGALVFDVSNRPDLFDGSDPSGNAAIVSNALIANNAPIVSTAAVSSSTVAIDGDGTDVISVRVSGDQYQGDPEFRLLIDGQQVGDVHSVSAVHSSDQWQTFDFNVDAPGRFDQIQVQFLNDAFGGSEAQDRNLYVGEVDVNGVALAPTEATYDRPGKGDIAGQSTMAWNGSLVFDVSHRPDVFNASPVAADDVAKTDVATAIIIDVLANDSDPNGDSLNIDAFTQGGHGAVHHNNDGTFTYTPDPSFAGNDTFDYTLTDGALTDTATVHVSVGSDWLI